MTVHPRVVLLGAAVALSLTYCVAAEADGWKKLFDGKSLAGWKKTDFGGEGTVHVKDGAVVMETGKPMTGITYGKDDFPRMDYEVTLEAKRLSGRDFFCTTTFPVGDSHCSFVVGGWGGQTVGLSSIDGFDASENETSTTHEFKSDRWYRVRVRVTKHRIQAWIDKEQMIDVDTTGKKLSVRFECRPSRPLGVCTYDTAGAVRDIRVRALSEAEKKAAVKKAGKE